MTKMYDRAMALAAAGFYVFPLPPNKKAPPIITDFPANATRDEHEIARYWRGNDNNIGISTTRYHDDDALVVIDIDVREHKNGLDTILGLQLEGLDFPPTMEVETPTGGKHLYYRTRTALKQGADVLGPGVDLRSRGGYVVSPGSATSDGRYILRGGFDRLAVLPDWVADRVNEPDDRPVEPQDRTPVQVDPDNANRRARQYLQHDAPLAVEGQGGDECTYKVACRVKDFGVDEAGCLALMLGHWNDRCSPLWEHDDLAAKVQHAYKYGQEVQGSKAAEAHFTVQDSETFTEREQQSPIERLNNEYAFVMTGGVHHILWETTDADGQFLLQHMSEQTFHKKHAALKMTLSKKPEPVTHLWMEHPTRRSYDGFVFDPKSEADSRYYNLWRGFAIKPAAAGESHKALDMFLEHARLNVCGNDESLFGWLMAWFAHIIQRPWEKGLVATVFRGGKGVGKNALIQTFGRLLGTHFLLASSKRYLVGNFNGHLENLLLFALDEAFWSGEKQMEGVLKDLVTGDKHLIEHKGKEAYTVKNLTRVAIIGNEKWLVPASHDERRFAAFDVGDGRKQDGAFFTAMRKGMEGGGYSVLLRYLMDYDLTKYNVNDAPATAALLEQKEQSLGPFEQWWLSCLSEGRLVGGDFDGQWPKKVDPQRLVSAMNQYLDSRKIHSRRPNQREMRSYLRDCAPSVERKRFRDGDKLYYAIAFPSLDACRSEWERFVGHAMDWS